MNLRSKTFSGIRWTSISNISVALLYLLMFSILARYLTKEEFGLASLAMVVLGFAQSFIDMGLSNAIIHKEEVQKKHLDTMYWMNFVSGIFFFLILNLFSGSISKFYNAPDLKELLFYISLSFLIQPLGLQFKVLLQKELEFFQIAVSEISGGVCGVIASFFFAKNGYGAFALVYSFIINISISSIIFFLNGIKKNKPSLYFKPSEVYSFLNFGLFQMGEKTINYFNTQFDVLIIGRILGTEVVGVYNIAKQLVMRPTGIINPIITRVTFPAMSKVQNDNDKLKNIYLKTINYLSSVNFLVYAGIFVLAKEVIEFFFGHNWGEAIIVLKILCIWAALRSTGNPVGSLVLAKGKARLGFLWNLGLLFITPLTIYLGSFWGLLGICWALVFLTIILIIPNWWFQVYSLCHAKFCEYHINIIKPLLLASISGFLGFLSISIIENGILRVVVASLIGGLSGITLNYFFNREFLLTLLELGKLKKS